ncbi:MAG: hypothetical protein GF353_22140 [Candidatus Lokiarchaeota archaeon]|nr:hypothetical protein [Candidatus Lokiarchaeota archaeon]
MGETFVDPETGMKIRKLTELRPTAAKEYQEAILHRVDHFAQKKDSSFNNAVENTVVNVLKNLLNIKVKVDDLLGDNREKVQDFVEKILFLGL